MEDTNFDSLFSDNSSTMNQMDGLFSTGSDESEDKDYERAAELKKKELFRKGKLQYEDNGELINDSNAMIRTKEAVNAGIHGVDWLLEASENLADFGQGDWIDHNTDFKAENQGREYDMQNKDFIAARALGPNATEKLIKQYHDATNDPNAQEGVYTLRKFDGYNPDGSEKYIYKYGIADVGANTRYRDQYVQDGYDIVEEKRFAGAEDWENTFHASQGALDNRVFDVGGIQNENGVFESRDKASGVNFGTGYTELYNKDILGTDVGKTQADYDRNLKYSKQLSVIADAKRTNGMEDSIIDAIQSGATKSVIDAGDFILDVLDPFGDNTLLNNAKKQENIDKWVGYDRTKSTQALNDAATYWKQGNYWDSIKTVVSDPNTMAESLPMMIAMMAPIPGTRVGKVASILSTMSKAEKAGASAEKLLGLENAFKESVITSGKFNAKQADKLLTTYKEYKEAPTKLKIYDHFLKNAGFHTMAGAMTNDVLDERIAEKIKNGESGKVSIGEALAVYAQELPLLALDRMTFKGVLGLGEEGKALKLAFKSLDKAGKKEVFKKVAQKAGELVTSGSGEGIQEYLQQWGEIFGTNLGVGNKSFMDVWNDEENKNNALMAGLGGLGAGVQTHGIGHGLPDIARGAKVAYDRFEETDSEKGMRKLNTVSDFKENKDIISSDFGKEIVNKIVEPEYDKIKDLDLSDSKQFNYVMKLLLDRRMQNAYGRDGKKEEGKYQILEILGRAVNKAMYNFQVDKDRTKLDKVLKLIKDVNDDSEIDFNIKDLAAEQNNKLFEQFIALTNKKYKPSNTGSDSAKMTGNKDLEAENNADIDAQKQKDYEALLGDINNQMIIQSLYNQGSSVNMDDEGNVKIDDKTFDPNNGMSAEKLKEKVLEYMNQGGKNFKDTADEIKKYGYIVYDEGNGDGIVIKDSMTSYDNSLAKEFRSSEKINQALTKNVGTSTKANFQKFTKWAKQRAEKLGSYSGKGSSWTASALADMESENQWFEKKISTLQGMLDSHSTKALSDVKRSAIQDKLTEAKADLKEAEIRTEEHRKQLKKYTEDVLGLDNFNFEDPEQVKQLAGVQTNYTSGDNGFEFGSMKVKKRENDSTLEQSQQYMRDRLMGMPNAKGEAIANPLKTKTGWKGFDNSNVELNTDKDLSHTATGSSQTSKTPPKPKSNTKYSEPVDYKTNNNKQTYTTGSSQTKENYVKDRITSIKSHIVSLNKMIKQQNDTNGKQYSDALIDLIKTENESINRIRNELEAKGLSTEDIRKLIVGKKKTKQEPVEKNVQTNTYNDVIEALDAKGEATDKNIDEFMTVLEKTLKTIEQIKTINGIELYSKKIKERIDIEIKKLAELKNELNETRKNRKDNNELKKSIGLVQKIIDQSKKLYRLIVSIGKKAYTQISDIEVKKQLVADLKELTSMIQSGKDNKDTIIQKFESIKQDYQDTHRLLLALKKKGVKIDESLSEFSKKYPMVKTIYERVNKSLKSFKRYKKDKQEKVNTNIRNVDTVETKKEQDKQNTINDTIDASEIDYGEEPVDEIIIDIVPTSEELEKTVLKSSKDTAKNAEDNCK